MRHCIRTALLVLGLVLVVGLGSGATSVATPIASPIASEMRSVHAGSVDTRSDEVPWTAERFRTAEPEPTFVTSADVGSRVSDRLGSPMVAPATRPGGIEQAPVATRVGAGTGREAAGSDFRWYDDPPFTRYEIAPAQARSWPWRAVGVLFFTQGGHDYRCSASAVGNFAVWTAGHCVHDGGSWSRNVVFIPAYDGKKACPGQGCPFGVWEYDDLWAMSAWVDDADFAYDFGGVIVKRNGGDSLVDVVGYLGWAVSQSPVAHWNVFGYPSRRPFHGNKMVTCQASTSSRMVDLGIGCDMTQGSSGGPYILDFGNDNYVNGNVSYSVRGLENELFSPYLGECAEGLFTALRASRPGSPAPGFTC